MPATPVYFSLGSNLGDRQLHLQSAVACLQEEQVLIKQQSSIYQTEPQDLLDQPWFLNMVVEGETSLPPLELLNVTQKIERGLGRVRTGVVPKGPRLIDIDILLFGDAVINSPQLMIPHPRMTERRFVLEPLWEIAPNLRHPGTERAFQTYLQALKGQQTQKLKGNPTHPSFSGSGC